MKTTVMLLILLTLFLRTSFAQDVPRWGLPYDARARLGKGSIREIKYSPDGTRIAVASSIGIWLYDTATHQEVALLTGHWSTVYSVAFSPDGNTIASGSADNTIRLWDVDTGSHRRILSGHRSDVYSVAFSPDGNSIASGSGDRTIRLWDVDTGTHLRTLSGHRSDVYSVAFSPDGNSIASGSGDRTIRLWDVDTGAHLRTLSGHRSDVYSVAFSPDGNSIASGSGDNTIRLWDVDTGTHLRTLSGHGGTVRSVAFSPDGNTIASGSADNTIRLWDVDTGSHRRILSGHGGMVRSVAFSPDGNTIASGSGDETVRLWDVDTGAHLRTLSGHRSDVYSVAFSPDGNTIASGSGDNTIRLWDVNTGAHLRTFLEDRSDVYSVAFSPDGNTIASSRNTIHSASGSVQNTIRLRDVDTGAHLRTLSGHTSWVGSVAFSPDGNTIASGSADNSIGLWDVDTGLPIVALVGHKSDVYSVAFSPDGNTIASGSADSTTLLWELTSSATINATVSVSPASLSSPAIGTQLTLSLNITDGENVAGYQGTLHFDTSALRYVESANGDYFPQGAFFVQPIVDANRVTLGATSLAGASNGDGTLATLVFEVIALKTSALSLSGVIFSDSAGKASRPRVENGQVLVPSQITEDVNRDGVVNIPDLVLVGSNLDGTGQTDADVNGDGMINIVDLVAVAGAFGVEAAAPSAQPQTLVPLTTAEVQEWLSRARQLKLTDPAYLHGIIVLEQLLAALTPKETVLLPNYPNPFNPETWIPYHLVHDVDVMLKVYDTKGTLVRRLDLGHQPAGYYTDQTRAAYWNGRNESGELVTSGIYFYQLRAGDYTAVRRMVIRK